MLEKLTVECDHCAHSDVCKHRSDFVAVVNAVANTNVTGGNHTDGFSMTPLDNFKFIKSIEIHCEHFRAAKISVRNNSLGTDNSYLDPTLMAR